MNTLKTGTNAYSASYTRGKMGDIFAKMAGGPNGMNHEQHAPNDITLISFLKITYIWTQSPSKNSSKDRTSDATSSDGFQ